MISINDDVRITEIDRQTFTDTSQFIKATIPYMNSRMGRQMAVLARMIELKNTFDFFNNPKTLSACGIGNRKQEEPEDFLKDIRKYCNGKEADSIDRMLNMINMGKFYEKFRAMENSPDFNQMVASMNLDPQNKEDLIANLTAMLSPEQKKMLEKINEMNVNT